MTGNRGGSFYPVGVGLAKVLSDAGMQAAADVGGGNSNILTISNGDATIGFTFSPTVESVSVCLPVFAATISYSVLDIRRLAPLVAETPRTELA